jgi:hypothetical protein
MLGAIGVRDAIWPDSAQANGGLLTQAAGKGKIPGKTNGDRLAFLASFGWGAEGDPLEILEVIIPKEFDEVYQRYNELQLQQGFDLSPMAGKRCKRYAYRVTGYPGSDEPVRAHILVYQDKIIGGDISSEVSGSFLHGFTPPAGS